MTPTNVEVVERFFQRPSEAELPALIDPEIEIRDYDLPDAGVYRGHEGLASYIGLETTRRNGIVFTLRAGRVVRFEYFTDPEQARAAVRIPSSSG